MILNYKNIILCLLIVLCSCATNKNINKNKKTKNNSSNITKISKSDPFYPLQESIMDLQNQIIELKSQVIEYESRIHAPKVNMELLKLVQAPNLKHEIIIYLKTKGVKYFCLGGGATVNDGIYKYKKSFSKDGNVDFYIGKKIYNIHFFFVFFLFFLF